MIGVVVCGSLAKSCEIKIWYYAMSRKFHPVRVVHLTSGLGVGGAESMLYKILRQQDGSKIQSIVISLSDFGEFGKKIDALGIRVIALNCRPGRLPRISEIQRLRTALKSISPHVIQGWMYHGNCAAFMVSKIMRTDALVMWNIRQTLQSIDDEKLLTRWVIRLCGYLSYGVRRIIFNSEVSVGQHQKLGYRAERSIVIRNGFDVREFEVPKYKVANLREKLGVTRGKIVIGSVARYHPKKGHCNLLEAAKHVARTRKEVLFILVGTDVNNSNKELREMIRESDLEAYTLLLGCRSDVPDLMNCFDIFVSASGWGEGFPNVVGEAMSAGIPCVVTDVGESARVVGDNGLVVEPDSPEQLAKEILRLSAFSAEQREKIGRKLRQRIKEEYSIAKIAKEYESLYREQIIC